MVDFGEKHRFVVGVQLRGEDGARARLRVRSQLPIDRVVAILAQERETERDDGVEVGDGRASNRHAPIAHPTPPPNRSFGRLRGSGVARPYSPVSLREMRLRATSASSTSSHADTAWPKS